ncbi:glucose-methanol-choline oxidoreductase, partial [Mycena vulgaris]
VDLGLLGHEIDARVLAAGVEFVQSLIKQDAMAKGADVRAVAPAPDVVGVEAMNEYIREAALTTYHPIGTAGMLPRVEGGVVDPELKVLGVKNLRVVDASVIPVHLSCHPVVVCFFIERELN